MGLSPVPQLFFHPPLGFVSCPRHSLQYLLQCTIRNSFRRAQKQQRYLFVANMISQGTQRESLLHFSFCFTSFPLCPFSGRKPKPQHHKSLMAQSSSVQLEIGVLWLSTLNTQLKAKIKDSSIFYGKSKQTPLCVEWDLAVSESQDGARPT